MEQYVEALGQVFRLSQCHCVPDASLNLSPTYLLSASFVLRNTRVTFGDVHLYIKVSVLSYMHM